MQITLHAHQMTCLHRGTIWSVTDVPCGQTLTHNTQVHSCILTSSSLCPNTQIPTFKPKQWVWLAYTELFKICKLIYDMYVCMQMHMYIWVYFFFFFFARWMWMWLATWKKSLLQTTGMLWFFTTLVLITLVMSMVLSATLCPLNCWRWTTWSDKSTRLWALGCVVGSFFTSFSLFHALFH